jgi:hypothetical protein
MPTSSLLFLPCFLLSFASLAHAQTCSHIAEVSGSLLPSSCGCQAKCECLVNESNHQVASCQNLCEYCVAWNGLQNSCTIIRAAATRKEVEGGNFLDVQIVDHIYTEGPWAATTVRLMSNNQNQKWLFVNNRQCQSQTIDCATGRPPVHQEQESSQLAPLEEKHLGILADCSNVGYKGATLNSCLPNYGIQSDESVLIGLLNEAYSDCPDVRNYANGAISGGHRMVSANYGLSILILILSISAGISI